MATTEQIIPSNPSNPAPPFEVQIPTDEQIEAVTDPGQLPDFLNRGLLRGVVTAIESRQRRVVGLDHEAVLVGRRGYPSKPERYKGLLAAILPHRRPDVEVLAITSNLGPGLFLSLSFDEERKFLSSRATHASHTGIEQGYYSKTGSSSVSGRPAVVGHVIRSALPAILESPINKG